MAAPWEQKAAEEAQVDDGVYRDERSLNGYIYTEHIDNKVGLVATLRCPWFQFIDTAGVDEEGQGARIVAAILAHIDIALLNRFITNEHYGQRSLLPIRALRFVLASTYGVPGSVHSRVVDEQMLTMLRARLIAYIYQAPALRQDALHDQCVFEVLTEKYGRDHTGTPPWKLTVPPVAKEPPSPEEVPEGELRSKLAKNMVVHIPGSRWELIETKRATTLPVGDEGDAEQYQQAFDDAANRLRDVMSADRVFNAYGARQSRYPFNTDMAQAVLALPSYYTVPLHGLLLHAESNDVAQFLEAADLHGMPAVMTRLHTMSKMSRVALLMAALGLWVHLTRRMARGDEGSSSSSDSEDET